MTPAELQTVCFEAANLVNERPLGDIHVALRKEHTSVPMACFLGVPQLAYRREHS